MRSKNKTLQRKLDNLFSVYIRILHADLNGYVKCISCGKLLHFSKIDCGHFVNRNCKNETLRFSPKNCFPQCRHCNFYYEGNPAGYALEIIEKFGLEHLKSLFLTQSTSFSFSDSEYKILLRYYNQEIYNHILKTDFRNKKEITDYVSNIEKRLSLK